MQDDHAYRIRLLRVLGLAFGLATVVGGMVGQGILRTPGTVAASLPTIELILLLWVAGGLMALLDAMALLELAASVPRAGGPTAFVERALGSLPGAIVGWSDLLNNIASIAMIATALATFTLRLGVTLPLPVTAIAVMLGFGVLNATTTRLSGGSQTIFSAAKGLMLLAIVVLMLVAPAGDAASSPPMAATLAMGVVAMRMVYGTYSGWGASTYFCEEVTDASRNVVRATTGGILLVTLLYLLVNIGVLRVLGHAGTAASDLAVADAVAVVLGPMSGLVVTAFAILSTAAVVNLNIMWCSRIAYSMSLQRLLPERISRVAQGGSPRWAIGFVVLASAALATTGNYEFLLSVAAVPALVVTILCDWGAIRLRRAEPALPRPFRMPLYPLPVIVSLMINIGLLILVTLDDPISAGFGLTMIVAIIALHLGQRQRRALAA